MSIIENLEKGRTAPDQFLGELLKVEKYKINAAVTIFTLIEQKKLEENEESYFKEFQPQGIRANQEQRQKIIDNFSEIQTKIKKYYGPELVEKYAENIIRNIFPQKAEDIIEIRKNIKEDLSKTNS